MTTKLRKFAVRDKSTGKYLPPGYGCNERGSTFQSPEDPDEIMPRFYVDYKTAKRCLAAWLRGAFVTDGEGSFSHILKKSDRIPENMEIVPVTIILNDQTEECDD